MSMREAALAGLIAVAAFGTASAQVMATVPQQLTIGYEHEGTIDAKPQACLALVKEITEWDKGADREGRAGRLRRPQAACRRI